MDWQLTCRVCLESGDMVSLFDWDENSEQLSEKYSYCCGIEVAKNDSLPTLICLNCVDRLTVAYQFKQQCLSSNDTLKECLEEFRKSSAATTSAIPEAGGKETITIKQEDGVLLQYDLPVEHHPQTEWKWKTTKTRSSKNAVNVISKPLRKKKGRPRKNPGPDDIAVLDHSVKTKANADTFKSLLESGAMKLKTEPEEEEDPYADDGAVDEDPDFDPSDDIEATIKAKDGPKKRRGRPPKIRVKRSESINNGEDVLLKETIMAYSEPIPPYILNPKPKVKKRYNKKYHYEKRFTCETCGSMFTSNSSLQSHIRRHLGIKPFVCSQCGYSCVAKEALRRHMLKHTGERPYQCRICDRRFGDFGTRQKHERLHMGLRPYVCSVCGRSFTYSYVLSNHMLTHTGEKKYSCAPCDRKFTKAHHLKYHNKVHHKEVYVQQQMEAEAKKIRQKINMESLSSLLASAAGDNPDAKTALDGIVDEGDHEGEMQMVEDIELSEQKETDQAVADIQDEMRADDYEEAKIEIIT